MTEEKKKSKIGGRREGAGRKKAPHTIATEQLRKYIIEEVIKAKAPIIRKLIERASGGNEKAAELLLERVLGRPITPLEHSGEGLEALTNAILGLLSGKKKDEPTPQK